MARSLHTLGLVLAAALAATAQVQVNTPDHNTGALGNYTTESETSHAVFGPIVVVGYNSTVQRAFKGLDDFTSDTGYAFSKNGGKTFIDAGLLAPAPGKVTLGDPSVAVDNAGNFYFASLGTTRYVDDSGFLPTFFDFDHIEVAKSTSTNPSVIFGSPSVIPGRLWPDAQADKELIAVDTSGGPFDGRIYVAWCEIDLTMGSRILFSRSINNAPTFAVPVALSSFGAWNTGAMPAVGPNGELYVVWGGFLYNNNFTQVTQQTIHLLKSVDGGITFANPDLADAAASKVVATPIPAPPMLTSGGILLRTIGFPYIVVDRTKPGSPTRGSLYVVFQAKPDANGPDRSDIFFTRSLDGGVSWSTPRSINAAPAVTDNPDQTTNDNWQPSISVSDLTGEIRVTFYDRRDDTNNILIMLYEAVSTDGGQTWSNTIASKTQFKPSTGYDPVAPPGYMGDYNSSTAVGGTFQFAWTDTHNLCTLPIAAIVPCSPVGRGDQDVYYYQVLPSWVPFNTYYQALAPWPYPFYPLWPGPDPGPWQPPLRVDLSITPWGYITGEKLLWYTPDIYEVNQFDVKTSPAMGVHNRLRAHVHNFGGIPAKDVTIRFKYAPIGAGIGLQAFKDIGSVTADFAATGGGGSEENIIPIDWDLTNLKEDNGGVWPMSIGAFKHFCIAVSVEHPDDINLSNNSAQNCFDDLEPSEGGPASPFRFLVANPFKRPTDAELIESPLPDGFRAELVGFPESFGKTFQLRPGEVRVVSVKFTMPANFEKLRFKEDVVSHLSLKIGRNLVGGVSARLAKRSAPMNVRLFRADFEHVFNAVLSVLTEFHDPVALANRDTGLINTVSIPVDTTRLRGIVRKEALRYIQNRDGRYLLSFRIEKVDTHVTKVTASSLVVVNAIGVGNMLGGQPVGSNGVLERERLDAIATKLVGGK